MKILSLAKARSLIKREMGIGGAALAALFAPSDMNANPKYPWYIMTAGTQLITVHTEDAKQGKYNDKMIALSVRHKNSDANTTEYFWGDTLEYSASYTDWKNREIMCENMEDPENDAMLHRLKQAALDECWGHFHAKKVSAQIGFAAGTVLIVKNNRAVFDRYDNFFKANPQFANYAQHFVCNEIPAKDAALTFIGVGSLQANGNPVFVLQDPKNLQVFLYDAKCKDGLAVSLQNENQDREPEHGNNLQGRINSAAAQATGMEEDTNISFNMGI